MEDFSFSARLATLRISKGVSAREMSLSIGQSESYINNIENGRSYPSMQVFFYICEYLQISPKEFFDEGTALPTKKHELDYAEKAQTRHLLQNLFAIPQGKKRYGAAGAGDSSTRLLLRDILSQGWVNRGTCIVPRPANMKLRKAFPGSP